MLTDTLITLAGPDGPGGHGYGPGFFPIFPLIFFLILLTVLVLGVIRCRRGERLAPRREAEAQLASRFAAGDIDEEEFRTRRAVLRDKG
ncbi:SHOCT domain-containing protein [Brachybacterium hainanense]|uniref:SHOCT domain-containing protein n=1 Tax=Brachybacterium hainanense TaxID=1541174 RepID=A0ABV6R8C9_9MICO